MADPHSPHSADRDDDASLEAWTTFLQRYATGQFPSDQPIPRPPLSPSTSPSSSPIDAFGFTFDNPVYSSVEITPEVARRARDFYQHYRYLPPPRPPLELLRERIIQEYDLYSAKQAANIQAAVDLVQAFFGGITTFTLFKHSQQELRAVAGPPEVINAIGLHVGKRLLPETSLCGHSILAQSDLYIPDLARDWRYNGNPYADELKGVKSYLGCVVSLHVDPASSSEERVVGVGVINSMHLDEYLPPLKADQKKVMGHISRMLETQLRATWEGHSRTREARARRAVSDLIENTLVHPLAAERAHGLMKESPSVSMQDDPMVEEARERLEGVLAQDSRTNDLDVFAQLAASLIRGALDEVEAVGVVDLRALQAIKNSSGQTVFALGSDTALPAFPLLAWDCSIPNTQPPRFFVNKTSSIFCDLLARHRSSDKFDLHTHGPDLGLESYLPASTSQLPLPFFSGDHPLFIILVATSYPYHTFRASDINFIRSMGVVLRARINQARVLEADAAKTAFLSSISHELRTPLHGVLSGIHLIREAVEHGEIDMMPDLLAMTESSATTLEEILNDTLDFGQLSQGRVVGSKAQERDLHETVMRVARLCVPRLQKDAMGNEAVTLSVEIEERDWRATVDQVAFQRILLNGLTNAIKFTKSGQIVITLTSTSLNDRVILQVRDSGSGFDPSFASKLFEPFTKADSFAPGAGLGLFITRALADRMGGSVSLTSRGEGGRGALFEVRLPMILLGDRPVMPRLVVIPLEPVSASAAVSRRSSAPSVAVDGLSSNQVADGVGNASFYGGGGGGAGVDRPDAQSVHPHPAPSRLQDFVQLANPTLRLTNPKSPLPFASKPDRPIRILVADDNDISRKILLTMLQRLARSVPMSTSAAEDGQEALERFKTFHPDLVLTDVSMPRMDGITAAAHMREFERGRARGEEGRGWVVENGLGGEGCEGGEGGEGEEGEEGDESGEENPGRSMIYAITGLGSSDPRLKTDAMVGKARLDGWLIKGQDKLTRIKEIVELARKRISE